MATPTHALHVIAGGVETPEQSLGGDFDAANHVVRTTPVVDTPVTAGDDAGYVLPPNSSYSGVSNGAAFEAALDWPFTIAGCFRVHASPSGTARLVRIGDGGAFSTVTIQATSFRFEVVVQEGSSVSRIRTFESPNSNDVRPSLNIGDLIIVVCRCLAHDDLRLSAWNISADAGFTDLTSMNATPGSDQLPMTDALDSFEYAQNGPDSIRLAWAEWYPEDIGPEGVTHIFDNPHAPWAAGGPAPGIGRIHVQGAGSILTASSLQVQLAGSLQNVAAIHQQGPSSISLIWEPSS